MDLAYDHIHQEEFNKKNDKTAEGSKDGQPQQSLNEEFQEAYKAFSSSPWGMKIGGFLGNAVKQGQTVYQEASKEVAELGQDAAKGLSTLQEQLATRARGLSITTAQQTGEGSGEKAKDGEDKGEATPTKARSGEAGESMSGSSTYLDKFRIEAARRIKELQKAEDAADEALLRFGSNIRNFLKDAVSVAPPSNGQGSTVLFESKDASGKRVIHASRQDAQLHVIHTTTEGFAKDPNTDEYTTWGKDFDVEKKTGDISDDLAKYPELRQTMEKLVPDQVPYADFWRRYYFLRHGLDAAEARRRDLLKAAAEDDEVGWGDDSDDDEPKSEQKKPAAEPARTGSAASSTTIAPPAPESTKAPTPTPAPAAAPAAAAAAPAPAAAPVSSLKPAESRKSNDEKSQADSEASYDVVGERSGVPSQAPSSPKESRKGDDSDDEDWE